jgi:hypothetical protein
VYKLRGFRIVLGLFGPCQRTCYTALYVQEGCHTTGRRINVSPLWPILSDDDFSAVKLVLFF